MKFIQAVSEWMGRWSTPFEQLPQNIDRGPADKSYRVFSKDHDLVIGGDGLAASLDSLIDVLPSATPEVFDPALASDARRGTKEGFSTACERLRTSLSHEQLSDTVVAVLLDHSGSMRGLRSAVVADFAEEFADAMTELGVAVEVLGFTTRNWKGGNSRKAWLARGRPKYPGRLCDLLHVVHRDAGSTLRQLHHFAVMRHPALYKENIDSEALLWARERLMALPQRAKVLIAISDGAPVDDATLSANWNGMLSDHIQAVIGEIESDGRVVLGGVGIDYDVNRYYSTSITAKPCDAVGRVAPGFIEQLVLSAHNANEAARGSTLDAIEPEGDARDRR